MAEKWEKQFKDFIKRASDDLKRTGEEIKIETQRLIGEVRDPARQAKVMEAFKDLRDKVTTLSKEAGEKVEAAMKKVEGAMENAFDKNKPEEPAKAPQAAGPATPAEPSPAAKPARKAGKTIGKKAGAKKAAGAKSPASKAPAAKKTSKSIGRKKPSA
jgi:hypothetical protein